VRYGRTLALACAAILIAGCSSGAGTQPALAPAYQAPAPAIPAGSSAAAHILAQLGAARTPASAGGDYDDGGWSSLQLPALAACGGGTYSNDCANWVVNGGPTTGAPCTRANPNCNNVIPPPPPDLNFCSAAAPAGLAPPAIAPVAFAPQTFSLMYAGSRAAPIVTFPTRWDAVSVSGSFSGTSTSAGAITVTPSPRAGAARGWLLFFTWSWPADVFLVPYQVNEVQIAGTSAPLNLAGGSPAQLAAYDCLGRNLSAIAAGRGFGFSSDERAKTVSARAATLNAPVWFGTGAAGAIVVYDDRGGNALTTVGGGLPVF